MCISSSCSVCSLSDSEPANSFTESSHTKTYSKEHKGFFFLPFRLKHLPKSLFHLLYLSSPLCLLSISAPAVAVWRCGGGLNCACKALLSFRFFSSWHGLSWLFPMLTHPLEGKELILHLPPSLPHPLSPSLFLLLSLHVFILACAYNASLLLFHFFPPLVHVFLRFLPPSLLLLSCSLYMLLVAYSSSLFHLHLFLLLYMSSPLLCSLHL